VFKTASPYSAFISYRRSGGDVLARLICDRLEQSGIKCFLDVEDLRNRFFDDSLLARIESTPNFLAVLTPGSLERCADPNDWFRREIAYAIQRGTNVVPILFGDFEFPPVESLPPELADLPRFNGVRYSHDYAEAFVSRLLKLLVKDAPRKDVRPEPTARNVSRRHGWRRSLFAIMILAGMTAAIGLLRPWNRDSSDTTVFPVPEQWPRAIQVLSQISDASELGRAFNDFRAANPPRIESLSERSPGAYLAILHSSRVDGYFFYDGKKYVDVRSRQASRELPDSLKKHTQVWMRVAPG